LFAGLYQTVQESPAQQRLGSKDDIKKRKKRRKRGRKKKEE